MNRTRIAFRRTVFLAILSAACGGTAAEPAAQPAALYDLNGRLLPGVKWLQSERLRGTLFHLPNVGPLRPVYLEAAGSPAAGSSTAVTLRGQHFVSILVGSQKEMRSRLESVQTEDLCPFCIYAVFGPQGETIAVGQVEAGKSGEVRVPVAGPGRYILAVNPGIASRNVARLSVAELPWALEGARKQDYLGTPLQYHFLRELKQAGLNLAMLDFETLDQEFVSDEGLKKWTERVAIWADHARRYEIRLMPAIDLGGTQYEVDAWGDSPKGLYFDAEWYLAHDKGHFQENAPIAPCPLSKVYWERIVLRRAREVARLSLENPYVVGIGIDPEMYACHVYGHYKPGGTCYCDHCLGGFLRQKKPDAAVLGGLADAKARNEWLAKQKLMPEYDKYLEDQTAELSAWLRDDLHKINPEFLICVYVLEIGNWSCRGMSRGFGTPKVPAVNFAEHTYYGVGYDPAYIARQNKAFSDWGGRVVPGYAVWDIYFPPTRRTYLAAHCYNLALSGGYWFWPGCDLLTDDRGGTRWTYQGQPVATPDYWLAVRDANTEIDRRMAGGDAYASPLARFEPVPWRGGYREGKWKDGSGVEPNKEPIYPIHIAEPCDLRFVVPERTRSFTFSAGAGGGAGTLKVTSPAGRLAGEVPCPAGEQVRLEVNVTPEDKPGLWTLAVSPPSGPQGDMALQVDGIPVYLSPGGVTPVGPQVKRGDLLGRWQLDEGKGDVASDTSGPPPYNGDVRDAAWAKGRLGSALSFDGKRSRVRIDHSWPMDNLDQYTLAAWVNPRSLPTKGHGFTIVGKGPEAPVQHFWWWIGYEHGLVLEVGGPQHRWGASFGTGRLPWELNRWCHVAVTFRSDGKTSTAAFYRDGQPIAASTKQEAFHSGDHDLYLGNYEGGEGHTFDGLIDEVLFYNRALGAEEIKPLAEPSPKERSK